MENGRIKFKMNKPKIVTRVKCKCGYEWATLSELKYICCPDCMRKYPREVLINNYIHASKEPSTEEGIAEKGVSGGIPQQEEK